jgi:DNA-binding MarR family transcriptional regulator
MKTGCCIDLACGTDMDSTKVTKTTDALTGIVLSIFRLNTQLLENGNKLVSPIGLTSSRWQILGAISMAGKHQTAPQVAAAMGITRQGAQKQLNLAVADGLVISLANPKHERSPLYTLTKKGQDAFDAAMALQRVWMRRLEKTLPPADILTARQLLVALESQLDATQPPLPGNKS